MENKDIEVPALAIMVITLLVFYLIISFILWDFTWVANCDSICRFGYTVISLVTAISIMCIWE